MCYGYGLPATPLEIFICMESSICITVINLNSIIEYQTCNSWLVVWKMHRYLIKHHNDQNQ